jgi:hypothetical protein
MIAEKIKSINITLGMMDGSSNEFEGLEVEGFPSMYLFKGGFYNPSLKMESRIVYEDEFDLSNIVTFLENHSTQASSLNFRELFEIREKHLKTHQITYDTKVEELRNSQKSLNDEL